MRLLVLVSGDTGSKSGQLGGGPRDQLAHFDRGFLAFQLASKTGVSTKQHDWPGTSLLGSGSNCSQSSGSIKSVPFSRLGGVGEERWQGCLGPRHSSSLPKKLWGRWQQTGSGVRVLGRAHLCLWGCSERWGRRASASANGEAEGSGLLEEWLWSRRYLGAGGGEWWRESGLI